MNTNQKKTALITGATSGIGAAFAQKFASQGYNVIITGRREEKIRALATQLSHQYNVDIDVILAELSNPTDQEMLVSTIRETPALEILVNNAGFAKRNPFHIEPFVSHEQMLNVHTLATIKLTYAALPSMLNKGQGVIINVSSMSAFIPFPGNAMYSATKAFVNYFTESLYLELRGTGVRVQALCPGMTRTDFHTKMGLDSDVYEERGMNRTMAPDEVVECSLKSLTENQVICVPGIHNQFSSLIVRKSPRAMVHHIVTSMFGNGRK